FRVIRKTVLAELAADARLLEPAKRSCRVEHVKAVDPDRTGADAVSDRMRLRNVASPHGGGEAVGCSVRPIHDLVDILKWDYAHYRAEDFFFGDLHFISHVVEDGRLDEITTLADPSATTEHFRAGATA